MSDGDDLIAESPDAAPADAAPAEDAALDEVDVEQAMAEEQLTPLAEEDGATEQEGVDYTPREGLLDTIEALTFVSHEPMTVAKVREVYKLENIEVPAPEVKRAFQELLVLWNDPDRPLARGITLIETGGGVRFRTEAKTGNVVRRLFAERPQRLSRAALETLAIIGYRQPLTRPQIDEIRGVDSSGALKALMDRRLVRVLGKAEDVGRPLLYGTTKTFLEFFGLTSLRDLPTLKQIQELDDSSIGPLLQNEARAAVVMDLFDPQKDRLVSDETDAEGREALLALEAALGQAAEVARRSGPGAEGRGHAQAHGQAVGEGEGEGPAEPGESASDAEVVDAAGPDDEEQGPEG